MTVLANQILREGLTGILSWKKPTQKPVQPKHIGKNAKPVQKGRRVDIPPAFRK